MEEPKDHIEEHIKIWQKASTSEFEPDVEQALQKVHHRIDAKEKMDIKKKTQPQKLYMLIGSAAAVVLLLISIIGIQYREATQEGFTGTLLALETGIGETLEYELPDGSRVSLNHSSSLRYPEAFNSDTREVYLEGEAFFDIAPDAEKPFIIHANHTQTKVVGTSFGVRAIKETDEVVVTVSTGIVNLSAEGKSGHIELTKGEQGICLPKEKVLEKNANPDPNLLAWKTKILVFKQTPLAEVAKVIESTYQTHVSVDGSIASLQLTSTFEKRSLEEVMQIIGMSLQVQVETGDKGILLTP
ncbi:FecR family protein [Bacteroides sp. 51]|uniref:FecR family protein n=1 Tax=Bacteroides sp. 51 TaxID=2302938 RepID=UPI0013D8629B|nr:FecR domain-containing protein [Bacteroides sp. 51]NDV83205.1 DUF4974 domain-containing protein [Bacteroides sp. 51]